MSIITKKIIPDLFRTTVYLRRWSLWLPFGASLKIHEILRADDDRCNHDHPWWFIRIILRGGYKEEFGPDHKQQTLKPWRPWAFWRVYYCPPDFQHRITELLGESSWSFVIAGPTSERWGFFTKDGWKPWQEFVGAAREFRIQWCDDGREISKPEKKND